MQKACHHHLRTQFRALLASSACYHTASVFDPMSARIAADLGFEVGILGGSVASLQVLAAPDFALITLSEFVEQATRIGRVARLPVIADADHGYGNALNVMRTVVELERAGVAALTLEDTLLPAQFGRKSTDLISVDEGVGKIRAALEARVDTDLAIIARTHAGRARGGRGDPPHPGLPGGRRRWHLHGRAYVTSTIWRRSPQNLSVPLMLVSYGNPSLRDDARLASLGVRIVVDGHAAYFAAIKATYDCLREQRGIACQRPQRHRADAQVHPARGLHRLGSRVHERQGVRTAASGQRPLAAPRTARRAGADRGHRRADHPAAEHLEEPAGRIAAGPPPRSARPSRGACAGAPAPPARRRGAAAVMGDAHAPGLGAEPRAEALLPLAHARIQRIDPQRGEAARPPPDRPGEGGVGGQRAQAGRGAVQAEAPAGMALEEAPDRGGPAPAHRRANPVQAVHPPGQHARGSPGRPAAAPPAAVTEPSQPAGQQTERGQGGEHADGEAQAGPAGEVDVGEQHVRPCSGSAQP